MAAPASCGKIFFNQLRLKYMRFNNQTLERSSTHYSGEDRVNTT
jgi:hypothetical protein